MMVQLFKNAKSMAFIKVAVTTALNRRMDSESKKEAISRALASGGTVIIGHLQAVEATLLKS